MPSRTVLPFTHRLAFHAVSRATLPPRREGKAVAMLASPSTSLSSCEALITQEEGRYYPLLRHAAVEAACAPESAAPSDGGAESDDAANATVPAVCCSCMHVHRIYPACTLHVRLHVHAHAACMLSASHATTRPGGRAARACRYRLLACDPRPGGSRCPGGSDTGVVRQHARDPLDRHLLYAAAGPRIIRRRRRCRVLGAGERLLLV